MKARVEAIQKAVELLAGQERSEAQVRQALERRGYPADEIAAAMDRVKSLGYLDDRRVAEVRARRGLAEGKSRADVQRRLEGQGIARDLAEAAVSGAATASGQSDQASARALLAARKVTGLKAARLLAARGFDEDLIRSLVGIDSPDEEL